MLTKQEKIIRLFKAVKLHTVQIVVKNNTVLLKGWELDPTNPHAEVLTKLEVPTERDLECVLDRLEIAYRQQVWQNFKEIYTNNRLESLYNE